MRFRVSTAMLAALSLIWSSSALADFEKGKAASTLRFQCEGLQPGYGSGFGGDFDWKQKKDSLRTIEIDQSANKVHLQTLFGEKTAPLGDQPDGKTFSFVVPHNIEHHGTRVVQEDVAMDRSGGAILSLYTISPSVEEGNYIAFSGTCKRMESAIRQESRLAPKSAPGFGENVRVIGQRGRR